ncbi:unnamed protein product [Protopolystoma xenopodis]|uniref:C-type lectin domain-containing protein n=1 Tax=Protopolystoma xenopodis TaxID=117903 RepID=A0A3S5AE49_9PLAT|nr:unnamed protein product [Protopolystoma xenopodis]
MAYVQIPYIPVLTLVPALLLLILCSFWRVDGNTLPINGQLTLRNVTASLGPEFTTTDFPVDNNESTSETDDFSGRIVLTNVNPESGSGWGLNQQEAEKACQKLPTSHIEMPVVLNPLRLLLESLRNQFLPNLQNIDFNTGHLLSIGSTKHIATILNAMKPVPKGSFWTGGKLIKYRVNNRKRDSHEIKLILTWTDGRRASASILGLPQTQIAQLQESREYCLAIDFSEAVWQARDCDDQLAFACLLTRRTDHTATMHAIPMAATPASTRSETYTATISLSPQISTTASSSPSIHTNASGISENSFFNIPTSPGNLPIRSLAAAVDMDDDFIWQEVFEDGRNPGSSITLSIEEDIDEDGFHMHDESEFVRPPYFLSESSNRRFDRVTDQQSDEISQASIWPGETIEHSKEAKAVDSIKSTLSTQTKQPNVSEQPTQGNGLPQRRISNSRGRPRFESMEEEESHFFR